MTEIPKKYNHNDSEKKWKEHWDEQAVYAWDSEADRAHTFSVDTPPPTVSGSLHIGHVFSYTQTDIIVRYQRMTGKSIFYPMGWDDNGLPTERRVQNVYGINCNSAIPYKKDWAPVERSLKRHEYEDVSRLNFIEACALLTQKDEAVFEHIWKKLGLSIDWNLQYATIDDHCRWMSQRSFLDLVEKGAVYNVESPTMWDTDFQTAVAQAELEDRECTGAYHDLVFPVEDGSSFTISTTRPELLPACIAVVAHPDDERYKPLFGKYAITPLFHAKVPILPATHADPEKGTGILMICTFGDVNDVEWWKQSNLPIKQVIGRGGKFRSLTFGEAPFTSENKAEAQANYDELHGLSIKKAQQRIVELLSEKNVLVAAPKEVSHPVKFYEKGDTPIEFIPTRQWFIRILDSKKELLKQGSEIAWKPAYMKSRYDNWVEGLNQDWCISRQRFFGVPFPVWYPVDGDGEPNFDAPLYASADQLPIDPTVACPSGYTEAQRNQPNGFIADPDVMDTWATSSLTPQIMSHWSRDEKRHSSVFPYDLRPQSHEIIRTWAFYTITKAWMHNANIPWNNIAISGWVLDPDRKKMSKSKGNVVTPEHLLDEYSSDAVRYWSAKARLGADTAFDESVFSIGKKLVTKIFNASKFVLMQLQELGDEKLSETDITEPLDHAFLARLNQVITLSTKAFSEFDYATALDQTESAFWLFCDHYIELVKGRAYREENLQKKRSALAGLDIALQTFLKLFAPHMPFITEEVWSWRYTHESASVHTSSWPTVFKTTATSDAVLVNAIDVLSEIRSAKSKANTNMKHPVNQVHVSADASRLEALKQAEEDLKRAGSVDVIHYHDASDYSVTVELA